MLDMEQATIYEAETRILNQGVKRNIKRFPQDFMFWLNHIEFLKINREFSSNQQGMSSQIVMTYPSKKSTTGLPYAFTK